MLMNFIAKRPENHIDHKVFVTTSSRMQRKLLRRNSKPTLLSIQPSGLSVRPSVHCHQQGSHKDHSCHFGMTKLLLPFLDGNFLPLLTTLSYSPTSEAAHFLEGAIPTRHLLHPTVTSSPSSHPTSQFHIFRSLLAFRPSSRSRHQKRSPHQQGRTTTKRRYKRKQ